MDVKLTTAGDVDISTGDLVLLTDADAIGQHLLIRFKFYLGEWFLDQRVGIPYFETVLVKGARLNIVSAIFRKVILTTPGVIGFSRSLELDYAGATRILSVSFEVNVVGSDTPLSFDEELII